MSVSFPDRASVLQSQRQKRQRPYRSFDDSACDMKGDYGKHPARCCTYQSGVIVSPNPVFDGAKLWSATDVAELSTAEESGFVGLMTAAFHIISGSLAGRKSEAHTIKIATFLTLEFFSPSPYRVEDQTHTHSTFHFQLQRIINIGVPIVQLSRTSSTSPP